MSNLDLLTVSKRLTIVTHIGDGSDGDSLAGLNVNEFPAGVLVYVAESNRLYRLKKNLDPLVIADNGIYRNVVDGIGSSAAAGRWVAQPQVATITLVNGTANLSGFDLSTPGFFMVSPVTLIGTPGFTTAVAASVAEVTATSASNTDDSVYGLIYVEGATDL